MIETCEGCEGTGQEPTFGLVHQCLLCGGRGDEPQEDSLELWQDLGGEG